MYHILPESQGNIIGICVEERMHAEDYATLLPYMKDLIIKHGTIRILADLRKYKGIEMRGILKALPYSFKYASRVEKKAVITDKHWMYTTVIFFSPFFKTEVRCFPSSAADKA